MKTPSAKTFIKNNEFDKTRKDTFEHWEVERMLTSFAKLHRKSIFISAAKSVTFNVKSLVNKELDIESHTDLTITDEDDYPVSRITINKESILECYPEANIK